mgnify:CR=1 FL=1
MNDDKVIGIIGGMGPEATASLFTRIIKGTKVEKDQDHHRVVIDSNPKIPDRTAAILGRGESPIPAIVAGGKNLEKIGANLLLLPCITSHYFIEEIQSHLSVPVINAIEELYKYIVNNNPNVSKIGVLATSGTIKSGLFNKYLLNMEVLIPDDEAQEKQVMEAIYGKNGIKSGNTGKEPSQLLQKTAENLIDSGADLIIAGCTEIGLALKQEQISKPLIDPIDCIFYNGIIK